MTTNNRKALKDFWNTFQKLQLVKSTKIPESYFFCDNEKDANACAELVVKGIKQATATSLWWFKKYKRPLPKIGDQAIITNWHGTPKAIIQTTKITLTPYHKITQDFAETEGEGDKSLAYWRSVHKAYYKREMEPYGDKFHKNMIIVCEHFKTIY